MMPTRRSATSAHDSVQTVAKFGSLNFFLRVLRLTVVQVVGIDDPAFEEIDVAPEFEAVGIKSGERKIGGAE